MAEAALSGIYRRYIACLNDRDWERLGAFVDDDVVHNDRALGLAGYRRMLEDDVAAIPDLIFNVGAIVADGSHVAARLHFDCTPRAMLFDLPVNGRRVSFSEHVFYAFRAGRIAMVWSLIDKAAIAEQLRLEGP